MVDCVRRRFAEKTPVPFPHPPTPARAALAALCARDADLAGIETAAGPLPWRSRPPGFAGPAAGDRRAADQQPGGGGDLAAARSRARRARAGRAAALGDATLRAVGLSRPKVAHAASLATAFAEGRLAAAGLAEMDDEDAVAAIAAVRGLGRWSAEVYLPVRTRPRRRLPRRRRRIGRCRGASEGAAVPPLPGRAAGACRGVASASRARRPPAVAPLAPRDRTRSDGRHRRRGRRRMTPLHEHLPIARSGAIATVTFDRPARRNAFDLGMWQGLQATMEALSADDALRCVVLRGAGEEAFCAGADIAAFAAERGSRRAGGPLRRGAAQLDAVDPPLPPSGGGDDLRLVRRRRGRDRDDVRLPRRRRGHALRHHRPQSRHLVPYAEIDPIVQMVGTAVAAEILIEGRILSGREAYEKGLLSRLVPIRRWRPRRWRWPGASPKGARSRRASTRRRCAACAASSDFRRRRCGGERLRRDRGFPRPPSAPSSPSESRSWRGR